MDVSRWRVERKGEREREKEMKEGGETNSDRLAGQKPEDFRWLPEKKRVRNH